ncbi:MAG: hypothetical protein ACI814_003874 [Mariniblastus sp.]|jgi:hypothetical protein
MRVRCFIALFFLEFANSEYFGQWNSPVGASHIPYVSTDRNNPFLRFDLRNLKCRLSLS